MDVLWLGHDCFLFWKNEPGQIGWLISNAKMAAIKSWQWEIPDEYG